MTRARRLAGLTAVSAVLLLDGPAVWAFGDPPSPQVPASDQGVEVCVNLNLLLIMLNLTIVLGPGQCPELTNPQPSLPPTTVPLTPRPGEPRIGPWLPRHARSAGSRTIVHVGPAGLPVNPPVSARPATAPLPATPPLPTTSKTPATSRPQATSKRSAAPAVRTKPAPPAIAAPAAPAPPAAPAIAAPPAPAPPPSNQAHQPSSHTHQPTSTSTSAPKPSAAGAAPAPAQESAPALEPGPVQSPTGYSVTTPFDRALRIPLRTPRLSTEQAALVIGIAVTGAALVSVGVPGRRDGE
jgi:hypothetical protein